jgi:hypothetical protein
MNVLHNNHFLLNKSCYTKILINYGNIMFFVRCMTYFKKLSNFEKNCFEQVYDSGFLYAYCFLYSKITEFAETHRKCKP